MGISGLIVWDAAVPGREDSSTGRIWSRTTPASFGSDMFRDSRAGFSKPVLQRVDLVVVGAVGVSVCTFAGLTLWLPLAEGMM